MNMRTSIAGAGRKWTVRTVVLGLGLALAGFGCLSTGPRDSGTHYAEKAVMPYIEKGSCPGAISVLYKDGRQETACMGWANVEKKIPMSMDRTFMICSQTKGFCGVCVAMLVEEGKLNLDDPVSKYLPEFKNLKVVTTDKDGVETLRPAKNVLTVRHVMSHTGGFPFEIPVKEALGWPGAPLRVTAAAAAAYPLRFEPGTKAQYSNTGIDIGAAIVEVVSGQRFDVFLKARVLDPLGMKETTFQPTDAQLARSISLYEVSSNASAKFVAFNPWMPLPHNGPTVFPSAGAGLWSTSTDLLKFYKMLMNKGVGENGVRILKEDTVVNILAKGQRPAGCEGAYSLGLWASDKNDGWFGHGGAWGTNCSVNYKTRELKFWVVQLLGNPRPWDGEMEKASKAFFDDTGADAASKAYTGRLN